MPRHSLASFLRAAKELKVVGLTEKDIDKFGIMAEKSQPEQFGGVSENEMVDMVSKNHMVDMVSKNEMVDMVGKKEEPVKEEPPPPPKNANGYNCSNFKFKCGGHETLKDHIRSTQVAQAQAQALTKAAKNKPAEKTAEDHKKLMEDIEKLKALKKGLIENTPYGCKLCNIVLSNETVFKKHNETFHSKKQTQCPKCNVTFENANKMKDHTKECLYSCKYCEKKLKKKSDFERHVATKHRSVLDGVKEEAEDDPLVMEVEEANLEESQPPVRTSSLVYHCESCDMKWTTKESLKSHYHEAHKKPSTNVVSEDGFTCDLCSDSSDAGFRDAVYSGVVALKAHMDRDHR